MKLLPRLTFAALVLSCGSLALAAPAPVGQDHHDHHGHYDHHGHGDYRHHDNHGHDGRYYSHGHYYDHGHAVVYRHYHHRPWARGYRYDGPRYYVSDYGYYHLRRPPPGYRWVRSDNDFLLVALTTGVILDIASH